MWLRCVSGRLPALLVLSAIGSNSARGHKDYEYNSARGDERSLVSQAVASRFLELATQRFEDRNGKSVTLSEEDWAFEELQLVRVPKAASSAASEIARRLGGCTPRGPCCRFPGSPRGSCPAKDLMCPTVSGCTGHHMGWEDEVKLGDPTVFSMANLRHVVDRMISGFFYAKPHSPNCAHEDTVDYKECFMTMVEDSAFQNVAARMLTGHYAYDGSAKLCLDKRHETSQADGDRECSADLEDVIQGACNLNFVTMCESWQSSVLLLFETLPWLGPSSDFFPIPKPQDEKAPYLAVAGDKDPAVDGSRHNTAAKYEEGITHIMPALREAAARANAIDEALHEFVSAKFCDRLRDVGLLEHPLVVEELATFELLDQRCSNATWVTDTLERYGPLTPDDCRLYEPMEKPQ